MTDPKMRSTDSRPKLAAVAAMAGVSSTTASYVLRGRTDVSIRRSTRARVISAARDLKYISPSTLKDRQALQTLGVFINHEMDLVESIHHCTLVHAIVGALVLSASREDFELNIYRPWHLESLPSRIRKDGLQALLVLEPGPLRLSPAVRDRIPCVDVSAMSSYPRVYVDLEHLGDVAAEYLLELGHRHIAYVNAPAEHDRTVDFYASLSERTTSSRGRISMVCSPGEAVRLAMGNHPPTAFVCTNEQLSSETLSTFQRVQIKVPEEASILGLGDLGQLAWMNPPLTTLDLTPSQIAWQALDLATQMYIGEDVPDVTLIPGMLRIRASTGPAK